MPINDRIGWFAVILIAIMLAPSWPWAAATLVAAVAALRLGLKLRQRASERQRLAIRCDAHHQAFLRGDDETGVYGIYPPGQVIIPDTVLRSDQTPPWAKMDS